MLINQIQKIGRAFSKKEDPVDILIQTQNPVRSDDKNAPKLLVVVANISDIKNISLNYRIIDYEDNRKKQYLLGLTSGRSTNYSLTLSTGWRNSGRNRKIKLKKMVKILKEDINKTPIFDLLEEEFGDYAKKIRELLIYIKDNKKQIQEKLANFLEEEGFTSFQNPLIFKIVNENGEKFLGEIPLMRKLYEYVYLGETNNEYPGAKCSICGNSKGIREGFNFGLFTIDQISFQPAFFEETSDFSYQYLMCTECYLYSILGYIIVNRDYKIKEGRGSTPIFHYVIPTSKNLKTLKDQVNAIKKAKERYDESLNKNLQDSINALKESIEDLKNKGKILTKNEIIKLKNDYQDEIEQKEEKLNRKSTTFPIEEIINQLYIERRFIPLMDIYFRITNQKLNPKTKQIMSRIHMDSEKMEKVSELFVNARNSNILNINKIHLSNLKNLMSSTETFLFYYASLLNLKPISREKFLRDSEKVLKRNFITFINSDDKKERREHSYRLPLRSFELYNYLFTKANLWRGN